jgi:hypothetical protein
MRDPIQDVLFRPETREEIEENIWNEAYEIFLPAIRYYAWIAKCYQDECEGAMQIAKAYAEALEEALQGIDK